jgi:hypothetical protein
MLYTPQGTFNTTQTHRKISTRKDRKSIEEHSTAGTDITPQDFNLMCYTFTAIKFYLKPIKVDARI